MALRFRGVSEEKFRKIGPKCKILRFLFKKRQPPINDLTKQVQESIVNIVTNKASKAIKEIFINTFSDTVRIQELLISRNESFVISIPII